MSDHVPFFRENVAGRGRVLIMREGEGRGGGGAHTKRYHFEMKYWLLEIRAKGSRASNCCMSFFCEIWTELMTSSAFNQYGIRKRGGGGRVGFFSLTVGAGRGGQCEAGEDGAIWHWTFGSMSGGWVEGGCF